MATRPFPLITRFAPSPTGHLHLGHVLHMWWVSEIATRLDGQVLFRMEDHDQSRCRDEFSQSIIDDVAWLSGLFQLSTEPHHRPSWFQSRRGARYQELLTRLIAAKQIYACDCSRQDIIRATTQPSGELQYPGTCRTKNIPINTAGVTLRMILPDQIYRTHDFKHGWIEQNPAKLGGDVAVKDRDGQWTYQFCVVVDDLDQNINLIVRGDDLLSSVGRQLAMRETIAPLLQEKPIAGEPANLWFLHHPLVLDEQGHKLSKRKFSDSISSLHRQGWTALQVVAEVARQAGMKSGNEEFHEEDIASLIPEDLLEKIRSALMI